MAKTVAKKKTATKKAAPKTSAKPKLLSGGNPQIAKGYGDAPVQAYIAAVPDWRRDVGKRLDAIITKAVPGVKKGGEVEFAVLRQDRECLVPELPRLHALREGRVLQRRGSKAAAPKANRSKRASAITTFTKARSTRSSSTAWVKQVQSNFLARRCEHMKTAKKAVTKAPAKKAKAAVLKSDWRRATLARVRALIEEAAPDAVEEAKWKKPTNPAGVPTWSQDGILFTGETYKDKIKFTFAKGAALDDPGASSSMPASMPAPVAPSTFTKATR
jgi:hypothetical protein